MKERWTETEVRAFPKGEHDYFDRKSGRLLSGSSYRDRLAKAVSAFANSGGGQILFGVEDDGSFQGLSAKHGRTSTREWLEQIIPNLVDPSLQAFRVHCVERSAQSDIPSDHDLIVVEIDDSPLAPHQSRFDKIYYHRVGGHSVPAPHFYLETLRQRVTKPVLAVSVAAIRALSAYEYAAGVLVLLRIDFDVTNAGKVVAVDWFVDVTEGTSSRGECVTLLTSGFPRGGASYRRRYPDTGSRLLPSDTARMSCMPGMDLKVCTGDSEELDCALTQLWNRGFTIKFWPITDAGPGEPQLIDTDQLQAVLTRERILWLLPDNSDPNKRYLGHGMTCHDFWCNVAQELDDHVHFGGRIHNDSENHYSKPTVAVCFWDDEGNNICSRTTVIERLPAGTNKTFEYWVEARDIEAVQRITVVYLGDQDDWER